MSETIQPVPRTPSLSSRLFYWLPPLLWLGAIFFFSTDSFSVHNTGGLLASVLRWLSPEISAARIEEIQFYVRKTGHFTVYAILAALLMRAFRSGSVVRWRMQWAVISLLIVGGYALLDEYHQSFTKFRTASPVDSLIDTCGGAAVIFVWWLWSLRGRAR